MLITCGVNHQTAPVSLRERLAFAAAHLPPALCGLAEQSQVEEAAILSTCNRMEVYCKSQDERGVIDWLLKQKSLTWAELKPHLYVHRNENTIKHVLRVASGLDSMVVGEPQILGQLKQAFALAQEAGTLGPSLHPLFQYAFASTKRIRTDTAIGRHPISFAYAIVSLAKRMFSDIRQKSILFLGAGEMVSGIARYFHEQGAKKIVIVNRSKDKAEQLAKRFDARALCLSELASALVEADIVVTALSAPLPVIGKGMMERCSKQRKRRPQLLIDLAVPRNIEPEIAMLEDAYLYSVDDLHQLIHEGLAHRHEAAKQAELLVETYAEEFLRRMCARQATKWIKQFRQQSEALKLQEVRKANQLLSRGVDAEKVLLQLANSLTNKLTHRPTVQLYQAAYESNADLVEAGKYYFELTECDE